MRAFPSTEYAQLVRAFESIAAESSAFRRRFWLVSIASYFGLPRAEFRRLFELWLLERSDLTQQPISITSKQSEVTE